MPNPGEHKPSHDTPRKEAGQQPYDPRTKRGPPQRLEDTDEAGDALNGTGEDNQHCKHEQ